jgi:heptosyltransferase-2
VKILVLRGGALGDLILSLPVLNAIRAQVPDAFIEFWGIQPQAGLVQSADRVDRLDALEVASLFASESLTASLRNRLNQFDIAVNLISDRDGIVTNNLASAGVRTITRISPFMPPDVHAVYHLASVLEPIGLRLHDPVPKLKRNRGEDKTPLLGFHPGSGSRTKNWPIERWNDFAQTIQPVFERLLLIGGEADEEPIQKLLRIWKGPQFKVLLMPSLQDLTDALSRCALFVGHDTGVTHLAAAVQTPTIALFGPTDPDVWRPLGDHVKVVRGAGGRMDTITAVSVGEAVQALGVGVGR